MANKKYLGTLGTALIAGLLSCTESPTIVEKRHYSEESQASVHQSQKANTHNYANNLYPQTKNRLFGGLELKSDSTLNLTDPVTLLATLAYEEARECAKEEKIAVLYTAINRLRKIPDIGKTLLHVILKDNQYSCFNSYNPIKGKKVDLNSPDVKEWQECIDVAKGVLDGKYSDPTNGATHYFNPKKANPDWPKTLQRINLRNIQTKHRFYKPLA